MPIDQPHILLLGEFLEELKQHDFQLGVDTQIRLRQVLELSALRDDDPETLKVKLAGILARNPQQQALFYRLFEAYLEKQAGELPVDSPPPLPLWRRWTRRNGFGWTLVLVGFLLMPTVSYWYVKNYLTGMDTQFVWTIDNTTREVSTYGIGDLRQYPTFLPDSVVSAEWNWGDGSTSEGLYAYHRYGASGPYEIRLMMESRRGFRDTARQTIKFGNPCASSIDSRTNGYEVNLTAVGTIMDGEALTRGGTKPHQFPVEAFQLELNRQTKQSVGFLSDSTESVFQFTWVLGDGQRGSGEKISHRYPAGDSATYTVRLFTQAEIPFGNSSYACFDTTTLTVSVPEEEELDLIPLSPKPLTEPDISRLLNPAATNWLPFLLAGIALLLYGLYELYLYRQRKLVLDQHPERGPPLRQHLSIEAPESPLFRSAEFDKAVTSLRARTLGAAESLDLPESLEATLRAGGLPELRFRQLTQASQYLVLIDQHHHRDHLAALYTALVRELNHRDISAEYYYYDRDPSLCWKDRRRPETQQSLTALQAHFSDYRLLILGTGEGLLDPYSGELADWAAVVYDWPLRALLSTRPSENWGRSEEVLAHHITFLPATETGFAHIVEQWQTEETLRPRDWQRIAYEVSPPTPESPGLIEELRAYLGERRFQWLCACAVYPALYIELTRHLGEHAETAEQQLAGLAHLFRLEWFRSGEIPPEIRTQLVAELDPEHASRTRAFLIELIQAKHNHAPANSLAEQDQQTTLAIYRYLNSARDPEDLEALRKALEGVDPHDIADRVSLMSLSDLKAHPLALVLPKSFFKGRLPIYGTKWQARLGMLIVAILLALGIAWTAGMDFFLAEPNPPYKESDMELLSEVDSAAWNHYVGVKLSEAGLFDSAENRLILASEFVGDSTHDIWESRFLNRFNWGTKLYRQHQLDSAQKVWVRYIDPLQYSEILNDQFSRVTLFRYYLQQIRSLGWTLDSAAMTYLEQDRMMLYKQEYAYAMGIASLQLFRGNPIPYLNEPDSNYYQSADPNVYTQELPRSRNLLIKYLPRPDTLFSDSRLLSIYKKLRVGEAEILIRMVLIPGGIFMMGSEDGNSDELPVHQVTVSTFELAATEVTFEQYDAFCKATNREKPNDRGWGRGNRPVIDVSWEDAQAYCRWLSGQTSQTWRLPTEAEWEYAARGGNRAEDTRYAGGADMGLVGWYSGNSGSQTHPVGQKKANELGLYDMSGNVWEWCSDWYDNYPSQAEANPKGPARGYSRVIRGGCWTEAASRMRVANRGSAFVNGLHSHRGIGFRPVRQLETSPLETPPPQIVRIPILMEEVKGGVFQMGSDSTEDQRNPVSETLHWVKIEDFKIGKYEVTQAQWADIMGENPSTSREKCDGCPVENVSWDQVQDFITRLNNQTGLSYRLPTEAEWEFAAGGGLKGQNPDSSRKHLYAGSDLLESVGWYKGNANTTHVIGQKSPNELQLYDMSGNVWEWCQDVFKDNYEISTDSLGILVNPKGPISGNNRTVRGGSFRVNTHSCRIARRVGYPHNTSYNNVGFRLCLDAIAK